jgi:saccharopine dehydrogenase-like NADP-dependent oxidoreductase
MTPDILIAGGYGEVGRHVAADLAVRYPGRVVVAGRTPQHASAFAAELGRGVTARQIDVRDRDSVREALSGVRVAVSCVDQPERYLLWGAIAVGARYTDVTPHLVQLGGPAALKMLHDEARRTGARLIVGTGIVPGISSVMARAGYDHLGSAKRIETNLLLSAADRYGPASLKMILEELSAPFPVTEEGRVRTVVPFAEGSAVGFGVSQRSRPAWLFPFSDQVFYPCTLGARTVFTRLALDPPWLGKLCAAMTYVGATRWIGHPGLRRRVEAGARQFKRHASDGWSLVVEVTARDGGHVRYEVDSHAQARAAGVSAAITAVFLEQDECDPGAWLPEQVVRPDAFFRDLARRSLVVRQCAGAVGR